MTVVAEILAEATRCGVEIDPQGGMLNLRAQHKPPDGLLDRLRTHKQEIMDTLESGNVATTENGTQGCEIELQAKCKTACEGLPIEPTELFEAMTDEDRRASPSLEELKAFAESLAEHRPKALPAGVSRAYTRLKHTLADNPGMTFAYETLPDEGGDHILMAVGVKGAGFAVLRMPRKKFDGFELLELVHRWNREGGNPA